jgi:hypothetical protein
MPHPRRSLQVTVHLTELGAETGLWCEDCALPSAVARIFAARLGNQPLGVTRITYCTECGANL